MYKEDRVLPQLALGGRANWLPDVRGLLPLRVVRQRWVPGQYRSHIMYFLIGLRESAPFTKSSTYCLILPITTLSRRFCGGVNFPRVIKRPQLPPSRRADRLPDVRGLLPLRVVRQRWVPGLISHQVIFKSSLQKLAPP